MTKNAFFSYDIISDNFFAVSITTTFLMAMLGFLSLAMWGFIGYWILVSRRIVKFEKGANIGFLIVNAFLIFLMALQCMIVTNKSVIASASALSLIIIIFYSYYFSSRFEVRVIMIGFLSGITAFLIFVYGDFSSAFLGKALYIFGLGGERRVSVVYNNRSYEEHIGKLLLLTAGFIYYVEEGRTIIAPMHSVKNIDISSQLKND